MSLVIPSPAQARKAPKRSVLQLTPQILQARPSRIFHRLRARAPLYIEISATLRAQSFAILAADGPQGNRQQHLLPQYILEQQTFPLIITDFGLGAGHRKLCASGVGPQRAIQKIKTVLYVC